MNSSFSPGLIMDSLGHLAHEVYKMKPLLPTYAHLIGSAIFPIFIAAHASLRRPSSAAPVTAKDKSAKSAQPGDLDEHEDSEKESSSPVETLTASDAILFPILAGATLTGLYLIIKWLEDPAILNKILGYYFSWIGTFFTFKFIRDVLNFARSLTFPSQFSSGGILYKHDSASDRFHAELKDGTTEENNPTTGFIGTNWLSVNSWTGRQVSRARRFLYYRVSCVTTVRKPLSPGRLQFNASAVDGLAATISTTLSIISTLRTSGKTPWYLTNLQGFSFCYGSLQFMTPGTASVGSLLLSLLFFYDIYMVFYTPMMVTVATKLDVPIKLLFPRPDDGTCQKPIGALPGSEEMEQYIRCLAKKRTMAMLGLGDIVVPGILIAYALRFDLYRYYLKLGQNKNEGKLSDNKEQGENGKNMRPIYSPARGKWAERLYTSRSLWSAAMIAKDFPKPYFKATLSGYVVGLVATLLVMQVWQHAQPALLYLVPGVLSSLWGTALWKGEVKLLWDYDESAEEKEAEKKQAEEAKEVKEKKDDEKANAEVAKEEDDREDSDSSNSDKSQDQSSKKSGEGARPVISFDMYIPDAPRSSKTKNGSRNGPNRTTIDISSDDKSAASSTPEIIAKEDAIESESEESSEGLGNDADAVAFSTRDDKDGTQSVKRRRKAQR